MLNGISTSRNVAASAGCVAQHGIDFLMRYLSTTTKSPTKRLTADEEAALSSAGLLIGVIYEDAPTDVSYFTGRRGHRDGVNACHSALDLHIPAGAAVYFAVDYDASMAHISGQILDYFGGVDQGVRDAGGGVSSYVVGIYGSGAACAFMKSHCPFVRFSWLAESTGWLGSQAYADWDIQQRRATAPLCSFGPDDYEENLARAEFGGFKVALAAGPLDANIPGAAAMAASAVVHSKPRKGRAQ